MLKANDERINEAFKDAIADLIDGAQVQRVIASLEVGLIDEALDALNITDEAFQIVADAVRTSYGDTGRGVARWLSTGRALGGGARAVIRFNARNLRAEEFLRERSSRLVTDLGEETRRTVRGALTQGLEEGRNPRNVALDIVGRIEQGSNRRTGGLIGLTGNQEAWLANARAQLESGDVSSLRAYLRRERRDQRFDRTINKAIREGTPLTRQQIDTITGRYRARLLQLRGLTIARTESSSSLNVANGETYEQAVENGLVQASAITKSWVTARDARVRDSHAGLHNREIGFDELFVTSNGSRLKYPLDTSQGASASDIIACRCIALFKIDFTRGVT